MTDHGFDFPKSAERGCDASAKEGARDTLGQAAREVPAQPAPPRGEGDDLAARDGIGYGGPINFTWEAGGGGYYLTFPNGHERRATATEAQLIAALARTPTEGPCRCLNAEKCPVHDQRRL